jgi:hypothetical protein
MFASDDNRKIFVIKRALNLEQGPPDDTADDRWGFSRAEA